MPNIELIIKLISTQDVRKWDNPTLLLWAIEMAKLIEEKKLEDKEETFRFNVGVDKEIQFSTRIIP